MKTLAEKTTWLLNHTSYNVTRAWYEVNPARTAAIYDREYKKYLRITLNKRKMKSLNLIEQHTKNNLNALQKNVLNFLTRKLQN